MNEPLFEWAKLDDRDLHRVVLFGIGEIISRRLRRVDAESDEPRYPPDKSDDLIIYGRKTVGELRDIRSKLEALLALGW